MVISKELADEMRKIKSIEDDVLKEATRPPTDEAVTAVFLKQVAEKIKNRKD